MYLMTRFYTSWKPLSSSLFLGLVVKLHCSSITGPVGDQFCGDLIIKLEDNLLFSVV